VLGYNLMLLNIVCDIEKMFVLLKIHFYVVDYVIIMILRMRLVKIYGSKIKFFKNHLCNNFVGIMRMLVEWWFSNFKYYILNYYTSYINYFEDYFLEVDYLYLLTPYIDIVPICTCMIQYYVQHSIIHYL
jgi:hypothetical protein